MVYGEIGILLYFHFIKLILMLIDIIPESYITTFVLTINHTFNFKKANRDHMIYATT